MDKAREVALKVLYNVEENKSYSNLELDKEIEKNRKQLNDKDIRFNIRNSIWCYYMEINTWWNNKKILKYKNKKNIDMDKKYFKNGNISDYIFR